MKVRRTPKLETLRKLSCITSCAALWAVIFAICAAECIPLSLILFALAGACGWLTAQIEKQLP